MRLAEVWLDDFKQIYYDRINNKLGDFGDVSQRRQLRESLQCNRFTLNSSLVPIISVFNPSFSWYLENIYPEQFLPTEAVYRGSLRSAVDSLCLTSPRGRKKDLVGQPASVYPCRQFPNPKWNIQTWYYTSRFIL